MFVCKTIFQINRDSLLINKISPLINKDSLLVYIGFLLINKTLKQLSRGFVLINKAPVLINKMSVLINKITPTACKMAPQVTTVVQQDDNRWTRKGVKKASVLSIGKWSVLSIVNFDLVASCFTLPTAKRSPANP